MTPPAACETSTPRQRRSSYFYDYAAQDPINNYDLTGEFLGIHPLRWANDAWRGSLDLAAVVPYGIYYGAYKTLGFLDKVGKHAGRAGVVIHVAGLILVVPEAAGLGGDAVIDVLKPESTSDEGRNGCQNPLHSYFGGCWHKVWLPGILNRSGFHAGCLV